MPTTAWPLNLLAKITAEKSRASCFSLGLAQPLIIIISVLYAVITFCTQGVCVIVVDSEALPRPSLYIFLERLKLLLAHIIATDLRATNCLSYLCIYMQIYVYLSHRFVYCLLFTGVSWFRPKLFHVLSVLTAGQCQRICPYVYVNAEI